MNLPILAGPRRRTRRALLALPALLALLGTAVAACALPAGASAAVIEVDADGALTYRASQETNTLTVRELNGGVEVTDLRGLSSRTRLCVTVTGTTVRCAIGIPLRRVQLGDRNDRADIQVPGPIEVDGGSGDDTFIAGGGPPRISHVVYIGGAGSDRISYANADRGVAIRNDGADNDGRFSLNNDDVRGDIEQLGGSRFNDTITDVAVTSETKELIGGPGNDTLRGGFGSHVTVFNMGPFVDGADTIIGGGAMASIDYSKRSRPVTATLDFNGADDGEAGEGDQILGRVGYVSGGQAADTLRARPGSTHGDFLDGGGGDDTLEGAEGPDLIYAFSGRDTVLANGGNDVVRATDGFGDTVGCGLGADSADLDSLDGFSSCETRRVGVLRLAPKAVRAGQTLQAEVEATDTRGRRQLERDAGTVRVAK